MKIVLLLMLGVLGLSGPVAAEALNGGENPGHHAQPEWFKTSFLDLGDDLQEAAAEGKRVLLYFYQDGCPYCAKLLEDNFGQRAIAEKTRRHFDVIALNMWGDREVTDLDGHTLSEKAFAAAMRVMFTPTLVFLDEQGKQVLRLNGYFPPHRFDLALDYGAGKAPAGLSFADYLLQREPKPAKGALHSESFFEKPPYALARNRHPAERPLIVLFEQKQCPACDEFHSDVLSREGTRRALARFEVVQLDMRADTPVLTPTGQRTTAAQWARELQVQYAPAMVFFDERGREVFRTEAYLKTFHTQAALDYVASGAYKRQPSFQRFVQTRADRLREQGVGVELME